MSVNCSRPVSCRWPARPRPPILRPLNSLARRVGEAVDICVCIPLRPMPTESMTRSTALITGASSGIGRELAVLAAADGYDTVLVARREERLNGLADEIEADHGVEATVIVQDLAATSAASDIFQRVQREGIHVDALINNAGAPIYGQFAETEFDAERSIMQVNMVALTELTKLFVRPMIERGAGAVLNTASLAGMYPIPKKAVYSSTKAYVLSFSRALADELEEQNVVVTALCPGAVDTEYLHRGNVEESNVTNGFVNDPESVAKAGWEGLKTGKRIVFPSTVAASAAHLKRVLPRKKVTELGRRVVDRGASFL